MRIQGKNARLILNGTAVGRVIDAMVTVHQMRTKPERHVKEAGREPASAAPAAGCDPVAPQVFSPAARAYNWNVVMAEIKRFRIRIDEDTRALAVSGGARPRKRPR